MMAERQQTSTTPATWVVLALAAAATACGGTSTTAVVEPSAIKCGVTLSGTSLLPANASQAIIQVGTERECEWSATTSASWLQPNPRAGTGPSAVALAAEANSGSGARSATLTVAAQRWTVTQAGAVIPPIFSAGLSARSTLLTAGHITGDDQYSSLMYR